MVGADHREGQGGRVTAKFQSVVAEYASDEPKMALTLTTPNDSDR